MTNPEEFRADVVLAQLVPEEVAQTALAKLAVQKSLRLDFTEDQHVHCALPNTGETWAGKIKHILRKKYGGLQGFLEADLEIEAEVLGVDESIWPVKEIEREWDDEVQAEKQRILSERS